MFAIPDAVALAEELATLSPGHRREAEKRLAQRAQANALGVTLGLDASDVYHQLRQFERSPSQRLRIGLALGRQRPSHSD